MFPALMWGQEMSVKDFYLSETDLTANLQGTMVLDQNGNPCALIKVETTLDDFSFDVGTLGVTDVRRVAGELWVYVPYGIKKITISHPKLGVIRDYVFNTRIEKGRTYVLRLNTPIASRTFNKSKKGDLSIQVYPTDASVELNDVLLKNESQGSYSTACYFGIWDILVEAPRYHSQRIQVDINDDQNTTVANVSLKPQFGWLTITGEGDETLYIDGARRSFTPGRSFDLDSGNYRLKMEKPLHEPYETTFQMQDSLSLVINPTFVPRYRDISLNVDENAQIWVNGEHVGNGNYRQKLEYGVYDIECRKDKHRSTFMTLKVEPETPELIYIDSPRPINGNIYVTCEPDGAEVYIDDKLIGQTPCTYEAIIGNYNVKVKKNGYNYFEEEVSVYDGTTSNVNAILETAFPVTIKTNATATLWIDGKSIGETPAKPLVTAGKHSVRLTADGYKDVKKTVKFENPDLVYTYKIKRHYYYDKMLSMGLDFMTGPNDFAAGANLSFYSYYRLYSSFALYVGSNSTPEYNYINENDEYTQPGYFMPMCSVGYILDLGTRAQFIPLIGYESMKFLAEEVNPALSQNLSKKNKARSFIAGAKFNLALSKMVELNLSPEYHFSKFQPGFRVRVGMSLYIADIINEIE